MAKGKQAYFWQAALSESEDILKGTQIMKALKVYTFNFQFYQVSCL